MRTSVKAAIVGLAASALALSGCSSREVNVAQPYIYKVPGLGNMYYTCTEEGTLIYFTSLVGSWDSAAEYEAFWIGACRREPDGRTTIMSNVNPVPTSGSGPLPDGDLGNTQPGQEDE